MKDNNNIPDDKPILLLVENDPPSRDVIKIFLKNVCKVDFAVNALEALEQVNDKQYDVLLMDINLGRGMNGLELTKEIRKNKGYIKTPIIALTAYAMAGDKEKFLAAGCSHYLSKPFNKETLLNLINSIIHKEI